MTVQLNYTMNHKPGFPGQVTSQSERSTTGRVDTATNVHTGRFVAKSGTSDAAMKALAAADDVIAGVVRLTNNHEPHPNGFAEDEQITVVYEGEIYVECEQSMGPLDPVFVRFATSGSSTGTSPAVGKVRKDANGAIPVVTVTPTPANNTVFTLTVEVGGQSFVFSILSDGSADATEIATAFRAAMQANAAFDALVASSGTATLVLTGARAGLPVNVTSNGPGVLAVVNTTPAAPEAVLLRGARVKWASFEGNIVCLSLNLPIEAPPLPPVN